MLTYVTIALAVLLVVAVCYGLNALSKKNKEVEKLKKDLAESKAFSEFFANMSHEIRTPINTMSGFSQLIADTDDVSERRRYAGIIEESSKQIQRLISDILDISKVDSGKMKFFPERFDLTAALDHECEALGNLEHSKDVAILTEFPYRKCMITTDRTRLIQIVTNFITNAFKYTSKGTITIGYEVDGAGFKVYVKDTGKGIESNPMTVFERFKRLDGHVKGTGLGLAICKSMAEGQGGKVGVVSASGVGSTFWVWLPGSCEVEGHVDEGPKVVMPAKSGGVAAVKVAEEEKPMAAPESSKPEVVKSEVEGIAKQAAPEAVRSAVAEVAHEASEVSERNTEALPEVGVEETRQEPVERKETPSIVLEKGSEEATKPEQGTGEARKPEAEDAEPRSDEPMHEEAPKDEADQVSGRRKRLLVAEDDDSNFLLFRVMLRSDYDLIRAKDGVEALDAAAKDRYDAILMDVRMPRMNGIEATERIRLIDKETPIIMVTASAFFADKEKSSKAGCTDFLTKPLNKAELLAALHKHIVG